MSARRLTLVVLVWLCGAVGCLGLVESSAYGETLHQYLSQITEVPASSGAASTGPFGQVTQMTVDSGHLWVDEFVGGEAGRTDEFDDATRAWRSQLPLQSGYLWEGIAVSHATGEVYVAGGLSNVAVFSAGGASEATWDGADTPNGSFGCTGCLGGYFDDVAVDNSTTSPVTGDVYVAVPQQNLIDVLKPQAGGAEPPAEDVTQLKGTCPMEGTTCAPSEVIPFDSPSEVAVDASNGNLVVFASKSGGNGVVDVFKPEPLGGYEFVRSITGPSPSEPFGSCGIGVDSGNGDIYAACENPEDAVYEFSAEGVFLGRMTGTPAGSFSNVTSVAVDPESHDVYVGEAAGGIDVFGPNVVIPDVATGPVSEPKPTSATLTGTVTLDHEGEATCRFVWGATTEFGHEAPCSAHATEEESHVQATLEGLEPDTSYCYRLQATNKNGTNPGLASQDQCFKTPGPGIRVESVTQIASTSATFQAGIDPDGAPTSSYFQYGTSSAYEASVPVPPGLTIGSGEGEVQVAPQHVDGLRPGTTYHYRVVALSDLGGVTVAFNGPDQMFTTQSAGSPLTLPDGREWELVSPPDKHGAAILRAEAIIPIQASSTGDGIAYAATAPIEGQPAGNSAWPQALSLRGPAGWESRTIAIPHEEASPVAAPLEYLLFSEDLSHGVVQPYRGFDPLLSREASEQTAFVRTDYLGGDVADPCVESCYQPLVTGAPGFANVPAGTEFGVCEGLACTAVSGSTSCPPAYRCGPQFQGASPDFSHIVVRSQVPLTKGGSGREGLYEWSGGKLTFVGDGTVGGEEGYSQETASRHAVSDDGSRVIFKGEPQESGPLLLHDTVKEETVQLGGKGATLQSASPDESRVVIDNEGRLEECAIVEEGGHLVCARSTLAPSAQASAFAPILGASEDQSYVYFVSGAVLTGEEQNPEGERAVPGSCKEQEKSSVQRCNLYVNHNGVNRFIAVLSGADEGDWGDNFDNYQGGLVRSAVLASTARVSPDGQWVAFMSQRSLTGYDTDDAISGQPDEEVYLYDAAAEGGRGRIVCASCNPTGARPHGASSVPGWTTSQYQSRYLSSDGRLFFDSYDALVPQDTNNTEDVYEYEPPGVGGCSEASSTFSARSGGCVGLISPGTSPEASSFMDASESGDDVFFLTAAQLSPLDRDTALDIYDAHVCSTAVPCPPPPGPPPPACVGDACQSPVAAPEDATPGSLTFSGPGNLIPLTPMTTTTKKKATRCSTGRKLEHGKCVKGKTKKKGKAKRSKRARRSRVWRAGYGRRAGS